MKHSHKLNACVCKQTHTCAHGDRCLQLCTELSGGKHLLQFQRQPDVNDSAHLSSTFLPHAEYTKQTEINQEMQMSPADSLHN